MFGFGFQALDFRAGLQGGKFFERKLNVERGLGFRVQGYYQAG